MSAEMSHAVDREKEIIALKELNRELLEHNAKLRIALGHAGRRCEVMHHDPRKHLHHAIDPCPVEALVADALKSQS